MCGSSFDPAAAVAGCAACPVGPACDAVCCPNCRFTFPAPAARKGGNGAPAGPVTLAALAAGARAVLGDAVPGLDPAAIRTLVAHGLFPGTAVSVVRTSPAVVVRIGPRTVSLDRALARTIMVTDSMTSDVRQGIAEPGVNAGASSGC